MLIQHCKGNVNDLPAGDHTIDWLDVEWYETRKRIMRKKTRSGKELALRFLHEDHQLQQGTILSDEKENFIAVHILDCDCISFTPTDLLQMASACYEIGNKHLPLFYEAGTLLVPFDMPLFRLLAAQGFVPVREQRQLKNPLRTSVTPHGDTPSLFSRIMKMSSQ